MKHDVSKEDLEIITKQLGRSPAGICKIMLRDAKNRPVVLKVLPMVRNKPFPSLYWLSHQKLSHEISHLEAQGLIKKLEQDIIPNDETFASQLKAANEEYAKKRYQELTKIENWENLPPSYIESIKSKGVGGLGDFSRVRCLHMHYAHHLVATNPVGQYLDQHFPQLKKSLLT